MPWSDLGPQGEVKGHFLGEEMGKGVEGPVSNDGVQNHYCSSVLLLADCKLSYLQPCAYLCANLSINISGLETSYIVMV